MVRTRFKYGNWLDSVTFITNANYEYVVGGTGGGQSVIVYIPSGATIVGLYGTKNSNNVRSLGLIVAK